MPNDSAIFVRGILFDQATGDRLPDILVTATSGRGKRSANIATSQSGADGRFRLTLPPTGVKRIGMLRLGFRLGGQDLEPVQGSQIEVDLADLQSEYAVCFGTIPSVESPDELPIADPGSQWTVYGVVTHQDGTVVSAGNISVVARTLQGSTAVADPTTTDEDGFFQVLFDAPTGRPPRLVAQLTTGGGSPTVITSSALCFSATQTTRLDIVTDAEEFKAPTEFVQLSELLADELVGWEYEDIGAEELAFLKESAPGWGRKIKAFVDAGALAVSTDTLYLHEALFGILREAKLQNPQRVGRLPVSKLSILLAAAVSQNVISSSAGAQANDVFSALLAARETQAIDPVSGSELVPLAAAAGLSGAEGETATRQWTRRQGGMANYWANVEGELGATAANKLKKALSLHSRVGKHMPMVEVATAQLGDLDLSEIATWSRTTWGEMVDDPSVGVPDGTPGADAAARRENYISTLRDEAELEYPAKRVRSEITAEGSGAPAELQTFFSAPENANFDIGMHPVTGNDANAAAAKKYQRLYFLSPDTERWTAMAEIGASHSSAHSIVKQGKIAFVADFAESLGGAEVAEEVFLLAKSRTLTASLGLAMLNPGLHAWGNITGQVSPRESGPDIVPEYDSVFNEANCSCDPALTLTSPAAYLVDLLSWVESVEEGSDLESDQKLLGRRPDLGLIQLSSDNTNKPLPYIDLVNEILETAVLTADGYTPDITYVQTTLEPAELLATPEFVVRGEQAELPSVTAYDVIAEATSALGLPYHRWNDQARTYLTHLGVPRAELLRLMATATDTGVAVSDRYAEALLLSQADIELITSADGPTPRERWGFDGNNDEWITQLSKVETFLNRAGLNYQQLLELLHCRAANPGVGTSEMVFVYATDPCDAGTMTLQYNKADDDPLTAVSGEQFRRFSRFLRLQRALGISAIDTDRILSAFQIRDIELAEGAESGDSKALTSDRLLKVGALVALARELKLPVIELAGWYAELDTYADRLDVVKPNLPKYDRVFLNAATFPDAADPEANEWAFRLNGLRDELADTSATMAEQAPVMAAALSADLAEINSAIEWSAVGDSLNLENISATVRCVQLAKSLGLTVREVWRLSECSPTNIFAGPAATLSFVEGLRLLLSTDFTAAHVLYLATHDATSASRIGVSDAKLQEDLGAARDRIRAKAADYDWATDVESATGGELLAFVEANFASAAATWAPDFLEMVARDATFTSVWQNATWLALVAQAELYPELSSALDLRDLRAHLIGTGDVDPILTSISPRRAYALNMLRWGVFRSERLDALREEARQQVGNRLGRDATFVGRVGDHKFQSLAAGHVTGTDVVDAFLTRKFLAFEAASTLSNADIARELDLAILPQAVDDAIDTYVILHKVGLLFAALGMDAAEQEFWFDLDWPLSGSSTPFGLIDFRLLAPYDDADHDEARFVGLQRARTLFGLREQLPGLDPDFADILSAAESVDSAPEEFYEAVATRTGWLASDIQAVCERFGYHTVGIPSLQDPDEFKRLVDLLHAALRLGTTAGSLLSWFPEDRPPDTSAYDADEVEAQGVAAAARSRYSDVDAWSAVARPMRDALRIRQRDALLAWLVQGRGGDFANTTELFRHYLIDPLVSPAMLTTRIRQASLSVQTYVQGHILGMYDEALPLTDDQRDEWEWRKQYRVWEAARKVFFYPENWIDPTLRSDKSPLFTKAEGTLGQGELTSASAEGAVLDYTRGLADIASLLPATFWLDDDEDDTLHVVSRAVGAVKGYYYRRRAAGIWTAWEKVDAGIAGVHLALVTDGSRVYLLWLTWSTESEVESGTDAPDTLGTWRNVELHWIERGENGKWSTAQGSDPRSLSYDGDDQDVEGTIAHLCKLLDANLDSGKGEDDDNPGAGYYKEIMRGNADRLFRMYPSVDDKHKITVSITFSPYCDYPVAKAIITPATGDVDWNDGVLYEVVSKYKSSELQALAQGDQIKTQTSTYCEVKTEPGDLLSCWNSYEGHSNWEVDASATILGTHAAGGYILSGRRRGEEYPSNFQTFFFAQGADVYIASSNAEELPDAESPFGDVWDLLGASPFRFERFYHPYAGDFVEAVAYDGAFALLFPKDDAGSASETLARQQLARGSYFSDTYGPDAELSTHQHASRDIEFHTGGAYSSYNWELFFHLPMLVATRLAAEQRFDEALEWLHCVFDPRSQNTNYPAPKRYWRFSPFMTEGVGRSVSSWSAYTLASDADETEAFDAQVSAWVQDPFDPHLIAAMRPGTYQRWVVMTYLDTLIGWGDRLFTQDSMESINEAIQLYLTAGNLLGDRPVDVCGSNRTDVYSYNSLPSDDPFSNHAEVVENEMRATNTIPKGLDRAHPGALVMCSPGVADSYFSVPKNEKLNGYWDTVADRLFKIRNSLNIEGQFRTLSIYGTPLDPGLLVRASALGVDIGTALASVSEARPNYRFAVMHGRAKGLAETVRSFGTALLSALEKKDGEELSLLRSSHERSLLAAVTGVKEAQVAEAESSVGAINRQIVTVEKRRKYYAKLSTDGLIAGEVIQLATSLYALELQAAMTGTYLAAANASAFPQIAIGTAAFVLAGGEQISSTGQNLASALQGMISSWSLASQLAGLGAGWDRRKQEWKQQESQADLELQQLEVQKLGTEIRLDVARRELSNHNQQVSNASDVDDWMRSKYTNQELYNWMLQKLSGLHLSAYDLAVTTARKAEVCYRHELAISASSFVQYSYWDNLRSGLMAGEALVHDLDRMDAAYLDGDGREFEITKQVSLAMLDGLALVSLMTQGQCYFTLPEVLFDIDFPGQYRRRIQSVSVSISCQDSSANICGTLTLNKSAYRTRSSTVAAYSPDSDLDLTSDLTTESIAFSSAQGDAGVFQLDLKDPRYLPFERRGTISTWSLSFTGSGTDGHPPGFDWSRIGDVNLSVRYTAKAGGSLGPGVLRTALNAMVGGGTTGSGTTGPGLQRVFSATRNFADAWAATTAAAGDSLGIEVGISSAHFPYFAAAHGVTVAKARIYLLSSAPLSAPSGTAVTWNGSAVASPAPWATAYGVPYLDITLPSTAITSTQMTLSLTGNLPEDELATLTDVVIVLQYGLT